MQFWTRKTVKYIDAFLSSSRRRDVACDLLNIYGSAVEATGAKPDLPRMWSNTHLKYFLSVFHSIATMDGDVSSVYLLSHLLTVSTQ